MSNTKSIKKKRKKDPVRELVDQAMKTSKLNPTEEQKDLIAQIFKFIVVGGIATLIDWVIYYILCRFCNITPLISNIISFAVSVTYNYWASCKYVFNVNDKRSKVEQFTVFIVLALIGLGINELLLFIFNTKLKWNYMLVKVIATIIVMIFNFITRKMFLEKN